MSDSTGTGEPAVRVEVPGGQGTQVGSFNTQHNNFVTYVANQSVQAAAVADRSPTGIHTHAEEIAGLTGLRRNLTGQFLPFVPPSPGAETHPDQLLSRLTGTGGSAGVLLLGAAGTGKTRTCFEVGNRAVAHGWTVLHVTPGEPLVSTDQLADAIAAAGDQVLVIIDYLNECHGLDLVALRQRILPGARRAGTRVALLASARPGWQLQSSADLTPLFRFVRLEPDIVQGSRIRDQIVDSLAPRARAVLGTDRLLQLCGLRPVIALLIALEAEAQAQLGYLDTALRGIKPEELISWLQRRLREDRLFPAPPEDLFADDEPDLSLQAITAMLAAGVQERENVVACGSAVLAGNTERAEHLLGILIAMGWVTVAANGLGAVHDLVTDQFLERTLVRVASWTARTAVAGRIFDACLGRARTIGRYATNLGRMIRDLDFDGRAESLKAYCAGWFSGRAGRAGQALAESEDEAAFALGAVIENPCWSPVAFANWPTIVAPWLARYSRSISARHILYKGLRTVGAAEAGDLIPEACQWLDVHGGDLEASFVIAPLLARADLGDDAAGAAIGHARTWLGAHITAPEAHFVLPALLGRADLDDDAARTAIGHARTWLEAHPTGPEAQFVLPALLDRDDLDQDAARAAITYARGWLDVHGAGPDAQFILHSLLGRADLDDDAARAAIGYARTWLEAHATALEAGYVLSPLLGRGDLGHGALQAALGYARTWLGAHIADPAAGFVLQPLLGRADLDHDAARAAIGYARTWLGSHIAAPEADYVQRQLLGRADLDHDAAQAAIGYARTWLGSHTTALEAGFVLQPLLGRADLDHDAAQAAIGYARTWLDAHTVAPEAGYVLPGLIARLAGGELDAELLQLVDHWVELNAADHGIGFIAKHLSRKGAMTKTVATGVVALARANPCDPEIAWHLSPIAGLLDEYYSLTSDVISALESCLRELPGQETAVNVHSQFDGLLERLARRKSCRNGIAAARLDDVLDAWLDRPESLTHNCSQGSYYAALLGRILSLIYIGRFNSGDQRELLDRLRAWVGHWQCWEHEDERAAAFALIDQAEALRHGNGARSGSAQPVRAAGEARVRAV